MKRQLDNSSGSIKHQQDQCNTSVNSKTNTNKYILNYSPPSRLNNSNSNNNNNNIYRTGDTIVQSSNYNKSQGYLRSSFDEDQLNNSKENGDQLSSTLDIKLLQKELSLTKKNLKEAQARANVLTHSNSKLQHSNDLLEQQSQKAEKRCKELIEKLSTEQLKINELNFLNKQIQKELDQLRNENCDTTERMKRNFDTLKMKYDQFVEQVEQNNVKVISALKKCNAIVGQNDRLYQNKKPDFNQEIYQQFLFNFHKLIEIQLRKIFINIQNIIDEKNIDMQDDEVNILQEFKNMAITKDQENTELRGKVQQLQQDLDRESAHTKDVLPRYRESLEKLKQNSKLMRDKIKELSDSKQQEKLEYEKKIKKIQLNYSQAESEKTQFKNQLSKLNKIIDEEQKESSSYVKEVGHLRKENSILKKKLEEYKGMVDDQESVIADLKKEISEGLQHEQYIHKSHQQQQININNDRHPQPQIIAQQHSLPVSIRKEKDELDFYLSKSPKETENTRHRKFFEDSDSEDIELDEDDEDAYIKERNHNKGQQNINLNQNVGILNSDQSESPAKINKNNASHKNKSKESIQNFMTFAESGNTSNNNTFVSNRFEDASHKKFKNSQLQNQQNRSKELYSFSQSKQGKSQNILNNNKEHYDQYAKVNYSYGNDYSSNNYQENDSSMLSYQNHIKNKKGSNANNNNNKGHIEDEIHMLDDEINQIKQYLQDELEVLNTEQQLARYN